MQVCYLLRGVRVCSHFRVIGESNVVAGSILQLSGIGVIQRNAEWGEWADQCGVAAGHSWGLASDVRARWPELMFALGPHGKSL